MTRFMFQARVDRWVDALTVDVMIDLGFRIFCHQRIRLARVTRVNKEAFSMVQALCPPGSPIAIETLFETNDGWVGEVWPQGNPQTVSDAILTSEMGFA